MCSSHQPENGADSTVEADPRPPMVDLPRANRSIILQHLRQVMAPATSEQELATEASKVEMADALGRAIHAAKLVGGPWGAPCSRPIRWDQEPESDKDMEPVPYGYDSGEFECECEQMALHLVQLMTAQAVMEGVVESSKIVVAKGRISN